MALKSRRRSYQKQRKSRQFNKMGGADPLLYVLYVQKDGKYDLIYIADSFINAAIVSNDIVHNLRHNPTQQTINDIESSLVIQKITPNVFSLKPTTNLSKFSNKKYNGRKTTGDTDESPLYFAPLSNGIIGSIFTNEKALEKEAPGLHIQTLKKNTMNWHADVFQ